MTIDSKIITTLVMFSLFAAAAYLSWQLPTEAAFMPLLLAIPGLLLCGVQLVIDFSGSGKKAEKDGSDEIEEVAQEEGAHSEVEMFMWLALFTALLVGFGFIAGGPLAVGLYVYFEKDSGFKFALFAAMSTFAVLYGMFAWLLELTLFRGFVLEWLMA